MFRIFSDPIAIKQIFMYKKSFAPPRTRGGGTCSRMSRISRTFKNSRFRTNPLLLYYLLVYSYLCMAVVFVNKFIYLLANLTNKTYNVKALTGTTA